jgi:tetratricopeptide (TPR) repeat protein
MATLFADQAAYISEKKGDVLFELGRFDDAANTYTEVIQLGANYSYIHRNKGDALFNLRRYEEALIAYDEALAAYEQALALGPRSVSVLIAKGSTLSSLKRYDEALTMYEQALIFDPRNIEALLGKGWILEHLKQYDRELAAYEQALIIDPDNVDALIQKGWTLTLLQRYREANVVYDQILKLDAPSAQAAAWNGKGYVCKEQEKYDDAVACINKAIELAPDDANYRDSLGDMYTGIRQYDKALSSLEEALKRDPKFVPAWRKEAVALRALGREAEADQATAIADVLEQ